MPFNLTMGDEVAVQTVHSTAFRFRSGKLNFALGEVEATVSISQDVYQSGSYLQTKQCALKINAYKIYAQMFV